MLADIENGFLHGVVLVLFFNEDVVRVVEENAEHGADVRPDDAVPHFFPLHLVEDGAHHEGDGTVGHQPVDAAVDVFQHLAELDAVAALDMDPEDFTVRLKAVFVVGVEDEEVPGLNVIAFAVDDERTRALL